MVFKLRLIVLYWTLTLYITNRLVPFNRGGDYLRRGTHGVLI